MGLSPIETTSISAIYNGPILDRDDLDLGDIMDPSSIETTSIETTERSFRHLVNKPT